MQEWVYLRQFLFYRVWVVACESLKQFKWGFIKVVVTRAGRLQKGSEGEVQQYLALHEGMVSPLILIMHTHSKLLGSRFHTLSDHKTVTRFKDVQRTGLWRKGQSTNKDGHIFCGVPCHTESNRSQESTYKISWSMNFVCSWLLVKFNIIIARHDPARKVLWAFLYWNLEEQVNFSN